MDDEKLLEIVNKSGFPLQINIAHLIHETSAKHGCKVIYQEHAWKNSIDNSAGFIDLLVEGRSNWVVFNIECKRVIDSTWLFISSNFEPRIRRQIKVFCLWKNAGKFLHFGLKDISGEPSCYEVDFCVVHGQDPKARPMLERIASDLVSSTEGFANEENEYFSKSTNKIRLYVSVIVTTARLKICHLDPKNVSVDFGNLSDAGFEEVPYVRFRKQLTTNHILSGDYEISGYEGVEQAKQNTVFVVNSESLTKFLGEFEINKDLFIGY